MRCSECQQTLRVLKSKIFDFTTTTFGSAATGNWPGYTAKVYIDNVELVKCKCGVAPNVPHLDSLKLALCGSADAEDTRIDPFSSKIYVGTWDSEE